MESFKPASRAPGRGETNWRGTDSGPRPAGFDVRSATPIMNGAEMYVSQVAVLCARPTGARPVERCQPWPVRGVPSESVIR